LAALAVMALAAPPAAASVVEELSLADMVHRASLVVQGTVHGASAAWNKEHTEINTVVELQVDRYILGRGPARLQINVAGGDMGYVRHSIAGQPAFAPGEKVVVFLEPALAQAPAPWLVVAMAAGKYSITVDKATGELVLARNLASLARWLPAGRAAARMHQARPLLLRDFVHHVQSLAQQKGDSR
jgi:hypothetical protein